MSVLCYKVHFNNLNKYLQKTSETCSEGEHLCKSVEKAVRLSMPPNLTVSRSVCVCLCVYSSERACPLTGCVCRGPSPLSGGGPGAAVTLPRARHAMCS